MAKIVFMVEDSEDGQHVQCEARSSDVDDKTSLANIIAQYLAENWVGLVTAARLSHHQRTLREGQELAKEEQVAPVTRQIVDLSGNKLN